MGHELYYESNNCHIGSVSIRRWEEISKLFPLLIDFVNRAMSKEWSKGTARDIRLMTGGTAVPRLPTPDQPQPAAGSFSLERMLSEKQLDFNEIHLFEATEWERLFAWCDFLADRDGAYLLYGPLVDSLRPYLSGLGQQELGGRG